MNPETINQRIKTRFDHNQAKRVLREKYQSKMIFAYNGGLWRASPELINLCQLFVDQASIVIEDVHSNPVEISPAELKQKASELWQEQMNSWLVEYESVKKQR